MSSWISVVAACAPPPAVLDVTPSSHSTPAATNRAQTLPTSVAIAAESSPGKRDKDKEKRFSLFSKKK